MRKSILFIVFFVIGGWAVTGYAANGYMITQDLWLRAVIHTNEKGPIEAVWREGGRDSTLGGDHVIWGYFYASKDDVNWGSQENPDVFVKIWFDRSGRLDVNYFHVSVPDIGVYSDYPFDGVVDEHDTLTLSERYIRQYYENSRYNPGETETPPVYQDDSGITNPKIMALILTDEKGVIEGVWRKCGEDTTAGNHKVIWGYFYASEEDVNWGSEDNPDLFVKIWFDASGRIDVNFFHASVPMIIVYSDLLTDDLPDVEMDFADIDVRYVRHEYNPDPLACSPEKKNEFVYNVMQDTYLWYDKVPNVSYTQYASPESLLEALRYEELDKWSYITTTEEHYAYMEQGRYVGMGFGMKYDEEGYCRLSHVFQDSPAGRAGLKRGDKILDINGFSMSEEIDALLWELMIGEDVPGVQVNLSIETSSAGDIRELTLTKEWVTMETVLHSDIFRIDGSKIGYMVFNKFLETSEKELDTVFKHFKQENVDELILDLRYNGGGRGMIAQHLASLITGDNSEGRVFVKYRYNDKYRYMDEVEYFTNPEHALDLTRVVVITADATCSASELVMNSLKPFAEVISVGETTCGKPVGMIGGDFCGMHFSPIEFKAVNALNEGDYFDGISPRCDAGDDLTRDFGDTEEASLKVALDYLIHGKCPDESDSHKQRSEEKRKKIHTNGFRKEIGAF